VSDRDIERGLKSEMEGVGVDEIDTEEHELRTSDSDDVVISLLLNDWGKSIIPMREGGGGGATAVVNGGGSGGDGSERDGDIQHAPIVLKCDVGEMIDGGMDIEEHTLRTTDDAAAISLLNDC
jgi:hypothetical protein